MCVIAASEDEEDICGGVSDTKNSRSNNKIQSLKEESLGLEYIFNSRLLHSISVIFGSLDFLI